jgi:phospholipase C
MRVLLFRGSLRMRNVALALMLACVGCSSVITMPAFDSTHTSLDVKVSSPISHYIKHVIIVVQENRTFDNLFFDFPGANYATSGKTSTGATVMLHPVDLSGPVISNDWPEARYAYDGGKMDRFDRIQVGGAASAQTYVYAYVKRNEIKRYWSMARTYVLVDQMFPTMFGGSFTAHLDLIASTAGLSGSVSEVDTPTRTPWGCDAPTGALTSHLNESGVETYGDGLFPCFTQFCTLAATLDTARASWRNYAPEVKQIGATPVAICGLSSA